MQLNLIPTGDHAAKDGHTPIIQFFVNVGLLADKSGRQQAVILFGMLFTLVIWVITLINLMVAVVLYLVFLFHHIPSSDSGLSGYCRRKVNKSVENIVRTKVEKALRRENALRARQEAREGGEDAIKRQPTLPNLDAFSPAADEKPLALSRQTTQTSLSEHNSRPGTAAGNSMSPSDLERQPTLPSLDSADFRPTPLSRADTLASSASFDSYGSNAPLIAGAGGMGHGPAGRMQSPNAMSPAGSYNSRPTPNRSYGGYSQSTQRSYTPGLGSRPSVGQSGRSTPGTYQMEPVRTSAEQNNPYFPPSSEYLAQGSVGTLPRSNTPGSASMRSYTPGLPPSTRSITPAASTYGPYNSGPPPLPRLHTQASSGSGSYHSYTASSHSPAPSSSTPRTPYRSYTQPNISSLATPGQYSPYHPQSEHSEYVSRQASGHIPPTQRPGTAPPTNRQNTPVADHVMEDIMNGY
jgi:Fungal potassium channel